MTPASPTRPPTFLDHIERLLLRLILVALAALVIAVGFAFWHARHQPPPAAVAPAASNAVTLVIDYADGTQKRFTDLVAKPDMTVLDAMNLAKAHARPLSFITSGSGDTTLLSQIDDLKNEGVGAAAGKARNWQYWINTEYGMVSIGIAKLRPGDRVTWAFRVYESDPKPPSP